MNHKENCNWVKSGCKYLATHHYCPHDDHACDCYTQTDSMKEKWESEFKSLFYRFGSVNPLASADSIAGWWIEKFIQELARRKEGMREKLEFERSHFWGDERLEGFTDGNNKAIDQAIKIINEGMEI